VDAEPPRIVETTQVTVQSPDVAPPAGPHRTLELGLAGFLMSGGPAGGYMGASPFLVHDFGQGIFVRPALLVGQSSGSPVQSRLYAARVDVCTRLEGAYAAGHGMQLDVCGGLDGGTASLDAGTVPGTPASATSLPYLSLGPSIDLRAELGRLAVTLRAVAGFSVAQGGFTDATGTRFDAPQWPLRVELAFSWDAAPAASEGVALVAGR
jgi:hypothetical protein